MYIVTGGAGFIGSAMVWKLNQQGITDILVVDDPLDVEGGSQKTNNLSTLTYTQFIDKDRFEHMLLQNEMPAGVVALVHMGACSSTTEMNTDFLKKNNTDYTILCANWALKNNVRFIYASSAATYGNGDQGFSDDVSEIDQLTPLNPYGWSKQNFDIWAKEQGILDQIVGLKFFNVFGPNEYHKGSMRSMVCKAFEQIRETGTIQLFQSHKEGFLDGEQLRDFVYVKDCVDVMWWLMTHPEVNGLFNLGTGQASTWKALMTAVFEALDTPISINYIPMPTNIRDQYQYFTQAEMSKLQQAYQAQGETLNFRSLTEAVRDYVCHYLIKNKQGLRS